MFFWRVSLSESLFKSRLSRRFIQLLLLRGLITTVFSRCGLLRGEHAPGQPPNGSTVAGRQRRAAVCLHPADQRLRSDAPPPVDALWLGIRGSRSGGAAAGRAVCQRWVGEPANWLRRWRNMFIMPCFLSSLPGIISAVSESLVHSHSRNRTLHNTSAAYSEILQSTG